MPLPTKPAVRDAWADQATGGANITDPGNSFVASGWPLSSTPPARAYWNWVLNYVMNGIRYLCFRGIADYDAAETYSQGSVVISPDGVVRQSTANNNTGNSPATSPTFWSTLAGYATTAALGGYVTTAQLNAAIANFVTSSQLASTLSGYVTNGALSSALASYVTNSALASTLSSYVTSATLSSTLASYATTSALTNEATLARNAGNLSSGTVPNGRLPNIGLMPGVTIAADPGTTPSGSNGDMFLYY